ncbi:MAG: PfkB family carbohydrate kinase [Candidatus Adiutrix sp.]|jgi:D-beta-D-heptose 7-phosphate kinase/D-beta-D-heptose 1-phosphate adenosyltransferase|nr:PfkB family carbohydrate kinase [Candidatus Adiutrix sp.]
MEAALELLSRLKDLPVLCVGDIMVDRYIYGQATRISPEAPVPVVRVKKCLMMPGGVGNVVKNLGALAARPLTVSVTGRDRKAGLLKNLFAEAGLPAPRFIDDPGRPTSVKTRIIAGIQQVVRFDEEAEEPLSGRAAEDFLAAVREELPRARALLLSDYGKGCLPDEILSQVIGLARAAGRPVVVDPKGADYGRYRGATLATPNRAELAQAAGLKDLSSRAELTAAGRRVMAESGLENLLVTLSEDGMMLLEGPSAPPVLLPSQAREVFDVTGAGDTVAAVMAAALALAAPLAVGARLANLAAGVVVGKVGTATAAPGEIIAWAEEGLMSR